MRKHFWIFVLIVMALLVLWFVVLAGRAIYSYYNLSHETTAHVQEWGVEELNPNAFSVVAKFYFEFRGEKIIGKEQVGRIYPNSWSAERAQSSLMKRELKVWFDPTHPKTHFTLEKKFPYKRAVSAGILMVLLAYFALLGLYVRVRRK